MFLFNAQCSSSYKALYNIQGEPECTIKPLCVCQRQPPEQNHEVNKASLFLVTHQISSICNGMSYIYKTAAR